MKKMLIIIAALIVLAGCDTGYEGTVKPQENDPFYIEVFSFVNDSLESVELSDIPYGYANGGTCAILAHEDKVFVGVRNITYDENWIADYGKEYIAVLDAETNTVLNVFEAGLNIAGMLIDLEGELHVLSTGNRDDIAGFVRLFDITGSEVVLKSQIELGSQPGAFKMNSDGMVYVAVSGLNADWTGFGGIMKYNSVNDSVLNGADSMLYSSAGTGILDICTDESGRVYAPLFDKDEIVILESDTLKTVLTTGTGPQGMVFTGSSVYLFNSKGDIGTLSKIDSSLNISNDILSLGKWPNQIIHRNDRLYVVNSGNNNIQIIDETNIESVGSLELSQYCNPMQCAISDQKIFATRSN